MSFDAIAPWYRTLETIAFGGALQRARVACLGELGSPRRALIVGEGNGRFLAELLRTHPAVEVDCADASERMLDLARGRLGHETGGVRFLHRDIMSWTPPVDHYDLIVTHFFLDCFPEEELAEIVRKLARASTADSSWLLADFCVPPGGFRRIRARVWLRAMYRFFRYVAAIPARELVDPTPFLSAAGFRLVSQQLFRGGVLKSERWKRQL